MRIARNVLFMLVAPVVAWPAFAGTDANQAGRNVAVFSASRQPATGPFKMQTATAHERRLKSFSLPGLDGVIHNLAEWEGKVIILNFWASWCSPCLFEIRDFVSYQQQYKARGLQIIGVGLDDGTKLRNVQRTLEINYPVLVADPKKNTDLMKSWGNKSGIVPFSVVIDRNGQVVYSQHGPIDRDIFDENILPLLDKI
ncbi:MAG: TlpA family protein disulfide reductase [Gammaproteobacteria bacterium]|nr:TlpA family protein disulfide reductase [Gammaproteobacteria bacterium]MBU1481588.1 TlpA family protein disulfide reductase [Gammaproteobacteria bacterium]